MLGEMCQHPTIHQLGTPASHAAQQLPLQQWYKCLPTIYGASALGLAGRSDGGVDHLRAFSQVNVSLQTDVITLQISA